MKTLLALGLTLVLAGCGKSHTAINEPTGTPSWLKSAALRSARELGDPKPRSIKFILNPNYQYVLRGDFRCPKCSRPSTSTPIQRGHVVVVRYAGHTRRATDFSIGPDVPEWALAAP